MDASSVRNKSSRPIFLSHAAADEDLVGEFETLLTKALNITSGQIFCSSLEGQGVAKGAQFVSSIRDAAEGAKAVIALLSPAYMESAFCLAELGAAWVLNTHRFPVAVPPNTFAVMNATLLGIVGIEINNENALAQMMEEIGQSLALPPPKAGVKARAIRKFISDWPQLSAGVAKATRCDASVHRRTESQLKDAREALESAESELKVAKQQISQLRLAKDAAQVKAISRSFGEEDPESELDDAIDELERIGSDIGGLKVLRLMILEYLGKPSQPDLREDYIARAIEIGLYNHDETEWMYGSDEWTNLTKAMKRVKAVFDDHDGLAAQLKKQGRRHKTDDIRFWEERLGI